MNYSLVRQPLIVSNNLSLAYIIYAGDKGGTTYNFLLWIFIHVGGWVEDNLYFLLPPWTPYDNWITIE